MSTITGAGNAVQVVEAPTEGWFMLSNARRAHYFRGTRSLCGGWMYLGTGPLAPDSFTSKDDCKGCRKKLGPVGAHL